LDLIWALIRDSFNFYFIPSPVETLTKEEITEYRRENLANYKVPGQIEIVSELPLTPEGKIQKSLLKELYLAEGSKNI